MEGERGGEEESGEKCIVQLKTIKNKIIGKQRKVLVLRGNLRSNFSNVSMDSSKACKCSISFQQAGDKIHHVFPKQQSQQSSPVEGGATNCRLLELCPFRELTIYVREMCV